MVSVHGLAADRQKARSQPSPDRTLSAIRAALEAAGVIFIAENGGGVKLRKDR
jgi:hypothetical protein